jgi:hypothetical protein
MDMGVVDAGLLKDTAFAHHPAATASTLVPGPLILLKRPFTVFCCKLGTDSVLEIQQVVSDRFDRYVHGDALLLSAA